MFSYTELEIVQIILYLLKENSVNMTWWGKGYKQKDTIRTFDIWCKLAQNSRLEARRFIEKKKEN